MAFDPIMPSSVFLAINVATQTVVETCLPKKNGLGFDPTFLVIYKMVEAWSMIARSI
jgi:hypothetical protein